MSAMKPSNETWYLILLVLLIVVAVALNEIGLGLISIFLEIGNSDKTQMPYSLVMN